MHLSLKKKSMEKMFVDNNATTAHPQNLSNQSNIANHKNKNTIHS